MPKHLEKKQTAKPFLISTQNIQNGYKKVSHTAKHYK